MGYGSSAPGSGGTAFDATWMMEMGSDESASAPFPPIPIYADLASGETLWVRTATQQAAEVRGVVIQATEGAAVAGGGGASLSPSRQFAGGFAA